MGVIGWAAAYLFFIVIEVGTMALTPIWVAGGALAGLIASLLGAGIELQLVVFAAVSFILLILTRPLALRYVNRQVKRTNAEGLIGSRARITERVDNAAGTGTAVLDGKEWTARALRQGEIIPEGDMAIVRKIQGVKLLVESDNREEKGA